MNWFCLGLALSAVAAGQTPVILISVDTLRADHVGAYGYKTTPTPNLDSFAQGGTVFENIDCQTPLTLPSHTSLFTSTYPFETGIQENAEKVPANVVTLAGVFKAHGYQTAAFISSVFLEKEMGLDQGFDTYDSPFHFAAFSPISGEMFLGDAANHTARDRRDGLLTVRAAARWLAAHKGQPVFVFIHLFDLHTPYTLPERPGVSRYDAQLELEDQILGRLKTALIHSGWWDRALTVLLSDHGEGLGDHGERSHGYFIYQSTVHVPLIMHWPAGDTAHPPGFAQPGGLIDVAPTILEALHIPVPPSFEGVNLLSAPPHAVYSETVHTHDAFGWAPLRSLRLGPDKYIAAPKPEFYDLQKDPVERFNLPQTRRAQDLRTELGKFLSTHAKRPTVAQPSSNAETQKLLTSLGYLGKGPQGSGSGADPKDRLAEFNLYEQATEKMADRQLARAIQILRQIVTQDPKNALARRDLASCYLDLQRYAEARTEFEKVVSVAPQDYPSQFGLGLAAKHLGLLKEARTHLEAACRLAPEALQCKRELDSL